MTITDLHAIRDRLAAIRKAQRDTLAEARAAAVEASGSGMGERTIAEALGVTRMAVRSWLGRSVT